MEVILLERIHRLGNVGDVVKVRDGFGRNFLIPRKKALRANAENKRIFELKRADIEARNAEIKAAAEKQAAGLEGLSVTIVRQASEEGKLYGSITIRDVADQLIADGHKIERSQLVLPQAIKNTGTYTAKLQLHPEVVVNVNVNVQRTDAEAA